MDTEIVATLGRLLELGMLYDCCNDSYIPGVYLWDLDTIEKNKVVRHSPQTSFSLASSDSLEEKTRLLQIDASLSVSVLGGLVEVEASASYLNDRSSSMRECRATIQYGVRTKTEHLNLSQMGSPTYKKPELGATHVIIQVEYGAEALMVFGEATSDEHKKEDIKANMKLMLNKIDQFKVSAEGKVQMTDEERRKVQNFTCTFHGDFELEENPSNFEEAVKVYKELPKLLGPNKEKVVPKKVWLLPLTELVSSAPKPEQVISEINCIKIRTVLEQLATAQMRTNDLAQDSSSILATYFTEKMEDFGEKLREYRLVWKDNLFKLLPQIRKGAEKEERLEKMLELHEESLFGPGKMDNWLNERETELSIVQSYINEIQSKVPHIQIKAHDDINTVLFDPAHSDVGVFVFNSLGEDDPYLSSLGCCLGSEKFRALESCDQQTLVMENTPWYRSPEVSSFMRGSLDKFCTDATQGAFFPTISYFHYPYNAGGSARRYSNGRLFYVNIMNQTEPEVVDVGAKSITLRNAIFPLLTVVSYRRVADGDTAQEHMMTWPSGGTLVISDLLPNTEYELRLDLLQNSVWNLRITTRAEPK